MDNIFYYVGVFVVYLTLIASLIFLFYFLENETVRMFIRSKKMKHLNGVWCVVIKRNDGSSNEVDFLTKFFAKRGKMP